MLLVSRHKNAFSLVELSIVLVILGLMVGGVLAGQSLIRAAELRRTLTFTSELRGVWSAFKDKYFSMPGDMTNATLFWGNGSATGSYHAPAYSPSCASAPGAASATGTCNGDGDGYLAFEAESALVWEHMKLSGLINYPVNDQVAWNTAPPSLGKGTIAAIRNNNCCGGAMKTSMAYWGGADVPNVRGVGLSIASFGSPWSDVIGAVISPIELWQLDSKVDDGLPSTGDMYGFNGTNGTAGVWYTTCTTASGSSFIYNVSEANKTCRAMIALERR